MLQAIRWAFEDEGAVKIAQTEFDERVIVDVYAGLALVCFLVMFVLLAPFLWRRFGGRLKPKSYRLCDLREEIQEVWRSYASAQNTPSAMSQERLRQLVRKLADLEIPVPEYPYKALGWNTYLARLHVLAEQRQYEQAKSLADEFALGW